MSRINKENAKNILSNVPEKKNFLVNDGRVLRNLQDLSAALADISEETFAHHVNNEKNDFRSWIEYVVGDKKLANGIAKIKSKELMLKKVDKRISQLNSLIKWGEKYGNEKFSFELWRGMQL